MLPVSRRLNSAPSASSFAVNRSYPRSMRLMPRTDEVPLAVSAAMRWLNPPRRSGTSMSAAASGVGPEITAEW